MTHVLEHKRVMQQLLGLITSLSTIRESDKIVQTAGVVKVLLGLLRSLSAGGGHPTAANPASTSSSQQGPASLQEGRFACSGHLGPSASGSGPLGPSASLSAAGSSSAVGTTNSSSSPVAGVAGVMSAKQEREEILEDVVTALAIMMTRTRHKKIVIQNEGIPLILTVLKAHADASRLVIAVCRFLGTFTDKPEYREVVQRNGGVQALAGAYQAIMGEILAEVSCGGIISSDGVSVERFPVPGGVFLPVLADSAEPPAFSSGAFSSSSRLSEMGAESSAADVEAVVEAMVRESSGSNRKAERLMLSVREACTTALWSCVVDCELAQFELSYEGFLDNLPGELQAYFTCPVVAVVLEAYSGRILNGGGSSADRDLNGGANRNDDSVVSKLERLAESSKSPACGACGGGEVNTSTTTTRENGCGVNEVREESSAPEKRLWSLVEKSDDFGQMLTLFFKFVEAAFGIVRRCAKQAEIRQQVLANGWLEIAQTVLSVDAFCAPLSDRGPVSSLPPGAAEKNGFTGFTLSPGAAASSASLREAAEGLMKEVCGFLGNIAADPVHRRDVLEMGFVLLSCQRPLFCFG